MDIVDEIIQAGGEIELAQIEVDPAEIVAFLRKSDAAFAVANAEKSIIIAKQARLIRVMLLEQEGDDAGDD